MTEWLKTRKELKELKAAKLRYEVIILSKIYGAIEFLDGSVDTSALLEMAEKMKGVDQEEFVKTLSEIIHNETSQNAG
ncbi:hypothetical protein GPL15_20415 [Clostridium sp. MCC353]|uniref:hypothetical protein n=1 Tax=Clostridium sp. MCC353 TaxID=2592646 RepID=UPI001C0252B8|nr:hypothetical protein [Clostridium sp. MCC353]MBT9778847.1 hypothetical protein [Clostridium sp. MCC353]